MLLASTALIPVLGPMNVAAETPGQQPLWKQGYYWKYTIDEDVDFKLYDFVTIDHIKANWTRTVSDVVIDGDQTVYKVWDESRGKLHGYIRYMIFNIEVDVTFMGNGLYHILAEDLAVVNSTTNSTFWANDVPYIGSFMGGLENSTTYDPPMPLARFPIEPPTSWTISSTVNITTKFFILYPTQNVSYLNTSSQVELTETPSAPAPLTVPAGTFSSYAIRETGTVTVDSQVQNVDRTWYYADAAAGVVKTVEGYRLVDTNVEYIPPNNPPIGPAGTVELEMDEDTTLGIALDDHFEDPDGDQLSFSLSLLNASRENATLTRTGASWNLTPVADWHGNLTLLAKARDPSQSTAEGTLVVSVRPVNDAPRVVSEPDDLMTQEDTPIYGAMDIAEFFEDIDGDPLNYSAEAFAGVNATLNGTVLDLVPHPDWVGTTIVTISATDPPGDETSTSFRLMVGEVNDPPVIVSSGGPAIVHEAGSGTFWVMAEDLDSEQIGYQWYVDGVAQTATGDSLTFIPGDLGKEEVTLRVVVSDEWEATDEVEWSVAILDAPRIVAVTPPGDVTAFVGDVLTFSVETSDTDTPDLSFTWLARGVLVGTGASLELPLGADDEGTWNVTVEVSDGVGSDAHMWNVLVEVPNLPPSVTIVSPANGSDATRGLLIYLECDIDDEDPDNVTVRWLVDGSPVASGRIANYKASREGQLVIRASASDGPSTGWAEVVVEVTSEEEEMEWDGLLPVLLLVAVLVVVLVAVGLRFRRKRGPQD
jgi:hypothetical protein